MITMMWINLESAEKKQADDYFDSKKVNRVFNKIHCILPWSLCSSANMPLWKLVFCVHLFSRDEYQ